MSRVFVHGLGAVSPAGWGVPALHAALENYEPLPVKPLVRPGRDEPLSTRPVPPLTSRPTAFAHPRLRRVSGITHHAIAAALEALGEDVNRVQSGALKLGIIICAMPGCVTYTRRFFEEVLKDPATASPLIFPETVFNAPASHLAALLQSSAVSYTLVGDAGGFLQGVALAAGWLLDDQVDGCLVVGVEEMDWIVADAARLFQRHAVHGDGAGALYLRRDQPPALAAELVCVTDSFSFGGGADRATAARAMRAQLPAVGPRELLCLGTQGLPRADAHEQDAWRDWTGARLAPKQVFGEAFTASTAWHCVAACDALRRGGFDAANVSVVGANQQAIGARFTSSDSKSAAT